MWLGHKHLIRKLMVLFFSFNVFKGCEAITNVDFNAQIRDYAEGEPNFNLSDVKTLQKQDLGLSRYANFAPVQNPVKFKDNYDSVISGSNHARGLLHQGHTGFDYDDSFGHGYEYPHGNHYGAHDYHHYDFHDPTHHHPPDHHHGHGHHKYYDHGLGHKALLWPIAGIALLGAAAALVTNPVLLQLGVVSGKRRRRQIEDIEHVAKNSIHKWAQSQITTDFKDNTNTQKVKWSQTTAFNNKDTGNIDKVKKRMLRKSDFKVDKQVLRDKLQFKSVDNEAKRYSEDRRFIPIPLKTRNP